jgi:curved DNA-binding protein CbpA
MNDREARDILGVEPDDPPEVIEGAARALAEQTHPDTPGGDREVFERVQAAKDLLLDNS